MKIFVFLIILMTFVCPIAMAVDKYIPDDVVVYRPDSDGAFNSSFYLSNTQPAPTYLTGIFDSNCLWGFALGGGPPEEDWDTVAALAGDVDADGLDDVVVYRKNSLVAAAPTIDGGGGIGTLFTPLDANGYTQIQWQPTILPSVKYFLGDITGDGASDVIHCGDWSGKVWSWMVAHSVPGKGLSSTVYTSATWGYNGTNYLGRVYFDVPLIGDFNGDGYWDICIVRPNADGANNCLWAPKNGTALGLTNAASTIPGNGWGKVGDKFMTGDFNGDGRSDAIYLREDVNTGMAQWFVGFSRFSDGMIAGGGSAGGLTFGMFDTDEFIIADIDGDGRDDAGYINNNTWTFCLTDPDSGTPAGSGIVITQTYGQAGDIHLVGKFCKGVNFIDYARFANSWKVIGTQLTGDLDFNGEVNEVDLKFFANRWLYLSK